MGCDGRAAPSSRAARLLFVSLCPPPCERSPECGLASAESESSGRGRARRADCSSEGLALRCFKTGKPYFRPALVGCVELRHAIHRRICGFRVVPRSPSSNVLEATARQLHRLVSFGTSAWLLGTSASPCFLFFSAHRPVVSSWVVLPMGGATRTLSSPPSCWSRRCLSS